ncbi:hypothetical protein PMAYCL1PPCAC_11328, partial [Pristionchus mayeri]
MEQGKSDDTCYLINTKPDTQSQAESDCQNQRAYLPIIHDQSFNDFMKRTALGYGLTDGIFIGLKFENESYVWADGSKLDRNWRAGASLGWVDTPTIKQSSEKIHI